MPILLKNRKTSTKRFSPACGLFLSGLLVLPALFLHQYSFAEEVDVSEVFPSLNAKKPVAVDASTTEQKEEASLPIENKVLDDTEAPALTPFLNGLFDRLNRNIAWGGYLRNESAFRIVRPAALTKILNIAQLDGKSQVSRRFSISGRGQCFYDAVYDIESVDVIHPRKGPDQILEANPAGPAVDRINAANVRDVEIVQDRCDLKELYLDANYEHVDVRIGKQIVRWGVVEGARVMDEINPLDFSELILRDIDDRYIPLFMLKTDLYLGPNTFELIFIPEVRGHRPAPRGTQWEQFRFLDHLEKPKHGWEGFPDHVENSEYAFRFTRVFTGLEISASYFYTWDDFPSSFRTIESLGVFGVEPVVNFKPEYNRLNIYGLSLAKTFSRFVMNMEATYVGGKNFGARFGDGLNAVEGEVQSDYLKYALGFDLYVLDMDISPAVIQQYILDYNELILVERLDTVGAVFIQKELIHNIWSANLLVLYFVNDQDWLIRPRSKYNFSDRLQFSFGVDIFEGKIGTGLPGEFNFIGFFDNNDRIFWDITYSF